MPVAEFIVWSHDAARPGCTPDLYAGLADNQLSPLEPEDDAQTIGRFT
jgi:hypothetical protein